MLFPHGLLSLLQNAGDHAQNPTSSVISLSYGLYHTSCCTGHWESKDERPEKFPERWGNSSNKLESKRPRAGMLGGGRTAATEAMGPHVKPHMYIWGSWGSEEVKSLPKASQQRKGEFSLLCVPRFSYFCSGLLNPPLPISLLAYLTYGWTRKIQNSQEAAWSTAWTHIVYSLSGLRYNPTC